jgi:radical SAM protein with 4Fe4S-binding SPASM domain
MARQGLRLATLWDYRFGQEGRALPPLSVNLELTARCNLHCNMCWLWGTNGINPVQNGELDTAAVKKVIDEFSAFRPGVYLQGGEILTRPDIVEILEHLAARHVIFGFTTNGTLITPEIARAIVNSASAVSVSLDGPEARNDRVRGEGNFRRAVDGVRMLIAQRGRSPVPGVKLNVLFADLDIPEMEEMIHLGAELGVDVVKFGNLQFLSQPRADQHRQAMKELFDIDCRSVYGYVSTPQLDTAELWGKLSFLRGKRNGVRIETWAPKTEQEVRNWYCGVVTDSYHYCYFPWFSVMVMANGSVVPCGEYRHPEYSAGNVREQSFDAIWNGERMCRFRQTLKEIKFFPGCDRCCGLDSYAR